MKHYWNNGYWSQHLNRPDQNDLYERLWVEKHQALIDTLPKGRALDLGCGIGQNTAYWMEKGFEVVSADLSEVALAELKRRIPQAQILTLDMTAPLPFPDRAFDVVFASLSIHYFNEATTKALAKELWRILKPNGILMGSVNASTAYRYIADHAIKLEENFYIDGERTVRLFDKPQLDFFFQDFRELSAELTRTVRFHDPKEMWEFIYQKTEASEGSQA